MYESKVPALDKMHRIFLMLMAHEQGFTLTEITNELGLSKATVFRMLSDLSALGYLDFHGASNRYSLGPLLISLGNHAKKRIDLKVTAHPFLAELSQGVQETVKLSIFRDDTIFVIDTVDSPKRMRIVVEQGAYFPPHIGAAGKLLLAHQEQDTLDSYLGRTLERYTPHTITDPDALRAVLEAIRETGISHDLEEESLGIKAAAAPVRNEIGSVIGAVSVPYLAHVYTPEEEAGLEKEIIRCAAAVSSAMGYRGEEDNG